MDYINIESENQKSGLIILLVLFHSACPYKNYCLMCFTELQTLFNFDNYDNYTKLLYMEYSMFSILISF